MTLQQRQIFCDTRGNLSLKRKGLMPKKRVRINYEHRNFRKDCISRPDLVEQYNNNLNREVA